MANLKCRVLWLVFLLAHLDFELIRSSPIPLHISNLTTSLPLTCPIFPPAVGCPPEADDECKNDQKCAELHPGLGMKCCRHGCDLRCVHPSIPGKAPSTRPPTSPVKGTCPIFPSAAECPLEPDYECNNDQKCAELHPGVGMKCCKDGCDLRCVPPIPGKAPSTRPPTSPVKGTCPIFPPSGECPPVPDFECYNDQQCAELHPGLGLKCCLDGCDVRCVPPIPGKAPSTRPPTSPVKVTCPVFPPAAECPPEFDDECKNDQQCDILHPRLGMICCKDGCNYLCMPPA